MVSESTATKRAPASASAGRSPPWTWVVTRLGLRRIRNPVYLRGGAQERTRTFTAVKPLAPEASASTNSATWAPSVGSGGGYIWRRPGGVNGASLRRIAGGRR